jgi:hypothetical protein
VRQHALGGDLGSGVAGADHDEAAARRAFVVGGGELKPAVM